MGSQRIFISALGSGPSDPPYLSLLRHGQSQFCKNFASFFSHLNTSDLLTPNCFATVLYLLVDDFSQSKRSVFSL